MAFPADVDKRMLCRTSSEERNELRSNRLDVRGMVRLLYYTSVFVYPASPLVYRRQTEAGTETAAAY